MLGERYRLQEHIASGAMGMVWKAVDERLDRVVAVKQLAPPPGLSPADVREARARTMREGRIAARLQHPHAIGIFDVVLWEGSPWLVMEYLPSRDLAAVLAEHGPLPPQEVARIGAQIADALAAAHRAGIVHRDVKPGNVLLGDDGTVKITDFGISVASGDVTITSTDMLAGTPPYLAPEVARGRPSTPASDVFSLGSTLYAAVEGEPPFGTEDNALALLRDVADGQLRAARHAGPLTGALTALLQVEPGARPNAADARRMLAEVAEVPPAAVAPTVPAGALESLLAAQPAEPYVRRRRHIWVLAACLALLGGLVAVPALLPADDATVAATGEPPRSAPPPASASDAVPAEMIRQAVRTYYGLLPGNPSRAWSYLGEQERAETGGYEGYAQYWSEIRSVQPVSEIRIDGSAARVDLQVVTVEGTTTIEPHRLVVGRGPDGQLVIESVGPAGSVELVSPGTDGGGVPGGGPAPAPDGGGPLGPNGGGPAAPVGGGPVVPAPVDPAPDGGDAGSDSPTPGSPSPSPTEDSPTPSPSPTEDSPTSESPSSQTGSTVRDAGG